MRTALVLTFALLAACSSADPGVDGGMAEESDAGEVIADAGESKQDGGVDAGIADAGVVVECSFNRECAAEQRCECGHETLTGCICVEGVRGTGVAGTPCTHENDCASAVCLEGSDGTYLCSKECADETECPTELPLCADIQFVGRICVRQPPG